MGIALKKLCYSVDRPRLLNILVTMKEIKNAIDFLTQANYNANRERGESPRRLALVFGKEKVAIMEKTFQNRLTITQK